jgi:hypothetical protein
MRPSALRSSGCEGGRRPTVVYQEFHPPKFYFGRANHRLHSPGVGHVGGDGQGRRPFARTASAVSWALRTRSRQFTTTSVPAPASASAIAAQWRGMRLSPARRGPSDRRMHPWFSAQSRPLGAMKRRSRSPWSWRSPRPWCTSRRWAVFDRCGAVGRTDMPLGRPSGSARPGVEHRRALARLPGPARLTAAHARRVSALADGEPDAGRDQRHAERVVAAGRFAQQEDG